MRILLPSLGLFAAAFAVADAPLQTFELTEYLDHAWSNELVHLPLSAAAANAAPDVRLLGPTGDVQPHQLAADGRGPGPTRIAFLADLPAAATATYRLVEGADAIADAVHVREDDDRIRVWNDTVGVDVRKVLVDDQGPIAAIRLRSGRWIGNSQLAAKSKPSAYKATLAVNGPVYAEIVVATEFADGATWTMRLRLIAGEPAIVVRESCEIDDGSAWRLRLHHPEFRPNTGSYRAEWDPGGPPTWSTAIRPLLPDTFGSETPIQLEGRAPSRPYTDQAELVPPAAERIAEQEATPFILLPWITWSAPRQVSCVSLFHLEPGVQLIHNKARRRLERVAAADAEADDEPLDEPGPGPLFDEATSRRDVVFVAAGKAGAWCRPGQWGPDRGVPLRTTAAGDVTLEFSLRGPARHWIIGSSTLGATIVPDRDLAEAERYAIKYCGTSLDDVNNMTLAWGDAKAAAAYPRVAFDRETLARLRDALGEPPHDNPRHARLWNRFLDSSASANRKKIARATAAASCRSFTENIFWYDEKNGEHQRASSDRVWTHKICRTGFVTDVDDLLGRDALTPAAFTRLRAQLAFRAYKLASPDYYSYERGWRANPNMTTMRHSVVGLLSCLLADHPRARDWYELGAAEIRRQLEEWVGPNGGWLESPHYQSLLGDAIHLLYAAHRNGLSDDIYNANLLKTVTYLAKISTPPDPRFRNRRHMPAVGNTYRHETTGLPGILAFLHRERDPQAASDLQWMWLQHGKPMWTGIGGGSFVAEVMDFLVDPDFQPAGPPAWGSEVFPKSGTVLRGHFPGDRETYMYLLHGEFTQHYDNDRGSFSLWGKGQPLSLDWGYTEPYSADMHNMLDGPGRTVGAVRAFGPSAAADYLHVDLGAWQRQALLVKDDDPTGANFFVVRDGSATAARWNQWFYTEKPLTVANDVVHMVGTADVDLDVWLGGGRAAALPLLTPEEARLETAEAPAGPGADLLQGDDLGEDMALEAELTGATTTSYIKTRNETKACPEGVEGGSNVRRNLRQRAISLPVAAGGSVTSLFYPRLRDEQPPVFTELADGRGVRIETAAGVNYAFLADQAFEYREGDVAFRGTVGMIRQRADGAVLYLGDAGEIRYGNHRLDGTAAATKIFKNGAARD